MSRRFCVDYTQVISLRDLKIHESYIFENEYFLLAMRIYGFIFPFILFFALESLNPASSGLGFISVIFSVFLLYLMAAAVFSLLGSVVWAYGIVSAAWLVVYIVNHFRLMVTGGVFVPTDFFLAGAAFRMMEPGSIIIERVFLLRVFLILIIHAPLIFVHFKIKPLKRLLGFPVAAAIFIVFFTGNFAAGNILYPLGLAEGTISSRYREHGLIAGFYSAWIDHTTRIRIENADELIEKFFTSAWPATTGDIIPTPTSAHPNVIVIMSEAFFDPTTMPNLSFSQPPMPNFNRLAALENSLSGNIVVPVYGGGTSNTEFEFLGGSPHLFFGSRFYVPFENWERYFSREIRTTLPWLFRANGYRAVSIHPYYEDFFNRNRIYPNIGFEEFITLEDMPDAPVWGSFISDEYFTDRIIEQILLAEEDNVPLFLFGISMQNHWGFDPMKYGTLDLAVMAESPYLNENEIGSVNSFLQGIHDADKQLGRLVDFVENRDTPTIIVFFGDHLPILGLHADRIFEKLGFVSQQEDFYWTLEDWQAIFQTPYLVWANYDLNRDCRGTVSTFALSALVAEASGIQLNRYFTYLLRSLEHFRAISNEMYVDLDGVFHYGWEARSFYHIQALRALWEAKIHGRNEFHYSLAELY